MIGGATTSRAHTAVKVDGKYDGPVVWVKDASRSVPTLAALLSDAQRPKLLADVKADYDSLRDAARRQARPADAHATSRRGPTARPIDWDGYEPPAPKEPGIHVLDDYDLGRAARLHRLAAVLQRLGDEGQVPRHPQQPDHRRDRARALRRRAGDARPGHRGEVADRQRRVRLLPGQRGGRRHRGLHRRVPHRGPHHAAPPAPAGRAPRGRAQPVAGRLRRPARDRAARPRRRVRGHRRARRPGPHQRRSRRATTTTPRSCSSRSPTGSPRRSPSGCTSGSAPSSGATCPTRTSTTRT